MSLSDPSAAGRTHVHGRILARSTLTGPISARRCVAYRVWGKVGGRAIEVSRAMPFALSLPGGKRGRIDGRATLEVEFHQDDGELRHSRKWLDPRVPEVIARRLGWGRPSERLSDFLKELGITEAGAGVLHELTLEGAMGALVEGQLQEPKPGGYRDALPVYTISEGEDGAPVVIRSRDAPPGT